MPGLSTNVQLIFPILATVVAVISLVVAVISLVVSIRANRRSARYQDFEYAPRLHVEDEDVRMATRSFPTAFHYRADLVNRGLKPVDVSRVIMDCGGADESSKREHHVVQGRFTLSPGGKREVSFDFSWEAVDDLRRRLDLTECAFLLRIRYEPPSGGVSEVQRRLGGVNGETLGFAVPDGERLK